MQTKSTCLIVVFLLAGFVWAESESEAEFRKPLADGLPSLPPMTARKSWTGKLSVHDGMMWKDDKPFFPIGYTFGTGDKGSAQAVAMGCNAVHFDVGWWICPAPGPVPEEAFNGIKEEIRLAGQWGMVAFPLLSGHYVPGWFIDKYSKADNSPLGSDGNSTGNWFPYSTHFKPMREEIPNFWRAAAKALTPEPNVMSLNYWNEPGYGGQWDHGDQFADYRPFAIEDYRRFLKDKYKTLEALNAVHKWNYASFEAVQPPRKPEELGRRAWLEWMRYGQDYFAGFFEWEDGILRKAAPDIRLANKKMASLVDSSAASNGLNWAKMGRCEDIFGVNIYNSGLTYRNVAEAARGYAAGKPVVFFEFNVMPTNAEGRTPGRVRTDLWAPVLGGAKGLFIFCLTDDPAHGLLSDKAVSPEARKEYVRFTQAVGKYQRELESPNSPARIAVLYSTTAALQTPGGKIPNYITQTYDLFRNSHYAVDFLPEEFCNSETLRRYQLIVLPSYSILPPKELAALGEWVKEGGNVIAFGHSLSTNEYLEPVDPPAWMGLIDRKPGPGDRAGMTIEKIAVLLRPYHQPQTQISGVEMVSRRTDPDKKLIPGAAMDVKTAGRVLAVHNDHYPTIVQSADGKVVYCCFDSLYSEPMRSLLEGILREVLHLKQNVRMTNDDVTDAGVWVSPRQDYKDANLRYLLVINTHMRKRTVTLELVEKDAKDPGWRFEKELLNNLTPIDGSPEHPTFRLDAQQAYLLRLRK
ncbi:MAG: beta-galactosidase [Phycisphaerae bacterium]|nr:beta-galactosidase [Phycisphaerae bacterium]